ncbi:hypothetical protein P7228_04200 [Altererythrobacter arenosus]|uniref:Uncharacterized protein n=1 Tax=Altererythrobacter arenosus TaxID=3032592 RepID=A0ABY8FWC4_9SPHN|nr:hypothetical protein [Altererythrobacter sp. CAU 1644]WFL78273.1 hypothetical protein P7228_04200 [Altererythrobacter sp. CAU 1644]
MSGRKVKISKALQRQLDQIKGDRIVVATVQTLMRKDIDRYSHLGLLFDDGGILAGPPAPPPPSCGIQALRNLDGWDQVRKDLPMEDREISAYVPSWNSGSYHSVNWTTKAYPRDHHPARLLTITATVLEPLNDGAFVRFRVDQPLDRVDPNFAWHLVQNVKLLREAVGDAQLFDADMSDEEFANIQHVDWELLPTGSADRVLAHLASHSGAGEARLEVAKERVKTLDRLGHDGFIVGTGKFARYFGAKFGERAAVLESLEYGNAIYVFETDWEKLSQLSRTELIKRRDPFVHRIPHKSGWQSVLRKLIRTL